LVLQESQFLSHPGVPQRGRRYPIAVDAGCHVAGDAAAFSLRIIRLHPHHCVEQVGELPSRRAIAHGLTGADRLQHAPGQQFAPAELEWCQVMSSVWITADADTAT
jgi:hypothetical protein